jgi:hypothetical protein
MQGAHLVLGKKGSGTVAVEHLTCPVAIYNGVATLDCDFLCFNQLKT